MTESSLQFDPARVKRVLLYRLGSLGDTVVALPALHVIERAFPAAQRKLLTNVPVHAKAPAVSAILEGSGLVEGYIHYPMATRSLGQLARVWWEIRRFGPEVLVYMMPPRGPGSLERDVRFFHLCGIRHIVGLPIGDLAASRFDPASGLWEQEAARLLRCVQPLGDADLNDRRWWDLRLTEAEQQKAREVLAPLGNRPMVACGPGTKIAANDWGRENWRSLLERLSAALPDHALVLVGAPDDAALANHAAAGWRGPVLQLCGGLTPRESAAVLAQAVLFVGPDSGPKHLAASQGVPCALVFGARGLPGVWYPPGTGHRVVYHRVDCAGCGLDVCVEQQKKCLTSTTVEEMFEAAMDVHSRSRGNTANGATA